MNARTHTEAAETAIISDNDVANQPNLEQLIANAEDYVRDLCAGFQLSEQDIYEIWAGFQDACEKLSQFNDPMLGNLELFKAQWEMRTVPWIQVKHLQSKYADTVDKNVRHTLHKSTLPYTYEDVSAVSSNAWGFVAQWIIQGEARTLLKGVSLTRGVKFESVKECSKLGCQTFCCCKDEELSLQRWLVKFAKSAGESWRTERRDRNQDEDNARAKARSQGLEVASKSKQEIVEKVWHLDSVAPRYDNNLRSTSNKVVGYFEQPIVEDYVDEANQNDNVAGKFDENGELDFNDYKTHYHAGGYEKCEKPDKVKGGLQGSDVRGISANPGPRFIHNRLEKKNAEIEAAVDAWKFSIDCGPKNGGFLADGTAIRWCSARPGVTFDNHFKVCPHQHDMRQVGSNVVSAEEWKRGTSVVLDFQEDGSGIDKEDHFGENDTLAGYAIEHLNETGNIILGDMLRDTTEPDFHEVLRRIQADPWFHREFGRVKLLEWRGKSEARVSVKGGGEHLVKKSDLKREPWDQKPKRKSRKAKKNVVEAVPIAA